jgi:hypothetical protein
MKCKTSDYTCPYHACMSDDCQRAEVEKEGCDWGSGHCEMKSRYSGIKPGDKGSVCYSYAPGTWSPVITECTVISFDCSKSAEITVQTESGKMITTHVGNFSRYLVQKKPGRQLKMEF